MDRIWLKRYPAGVPAEIDAGEYCLDQGAVRRGLREIREPAGVLQHGHDLDLRPARALEPRVRGVAAAQVGTCARRPGRADDAERPAVPGRAVRRSSRRAWSSSTRIRCTRARELEHQLSDSGAKAIVILENFAHVLQAVLPKTQIKNVLVTGVGDLLSLPRGAIVNFVLRHVRKQVPAWSIPGSLRFKSALSAGLGLETAPVPTVGGRHRVSAVHGRHDRRRKGRDAHAPQHRRERAAGRAPGSSRR